MNLDTTYMGLRLRSPIVVSACPLSEDIDNILRMEDKGAGAVVLFSLFEEQIRQEAAQHESLFQTTTNTSAEAGGFFPALEDYRIRTDDYLDLIRVAKERVGIPIIASLNGITDDGWIEYAQLMQEAGADGIEVNVFYIPADLTLDGPSVEQKYIGIVRRLKQHVQLPVAVKLNPYFSAMGHMARQLEAAGADALVLFNRFYQPDFNIHSLTVKHSLEYSEAGEIRLPLLWLSVLSGQVRASLAATTGVQSATEVIKYLLAGADVTMTASALYKYGIGYLENLHIDLVHWMQRMHFTSVSAFRGRMNQRNVSDPSAFERANYIRVLGKG